jgi:hypothetical protein
MDGSNSCLLGCTPRAQHSCRSRRIPQSPNLLSLKRAEHRRGRIRRDSLLVGHIRNVQLLRKDRFRGRNGALPDSFLQSQPADTSQKHPHS